MTTDIDTSFPTTTFESVEFTGAGAMKSNFKGNLIFEVANLPQALVRMQALHTTKGKLVFVSDQGQIPDAGDEVRDWASTELQASEEGEVEYQRTCIGGDCPHFCVPKEGDLAGEYVCYQDAANELLVVCVHGETLCPLGVEEVDQDDGEAENESTDETSSEGAESAKAARGAGVVIVLYPGDDEPHVTQVGQFTRYGELVADYGTAAGIEVTMGEYVVHGEDDGQDRDLGAGISADDYGKRLLVAEVA